MLSFCQVRILPLPFSNRSIIVIDLYRSLYISFQPECLFVLLVHLNHFCLFFNLQGSCNGPCSSCWTECCKFCSPPSCHFFKLCDLSRFFGFTRLSKKQFVLPLPLPFFSGAILDLGTRSSCSGGVLWRPETDAPDAFHVLRDRRVFYLFVAFHHGIIRIASTLVAIIVFKTCIRS